MVFWILLNYTKFRTQLFNDGIRWLCYKFTAANLNPTFANDIQFRYDFSLLQLRPCAVTDPADWAQEFNLAAHCNLTGDCHAPCDVAGANTTSGTLLLSPRVWIITSSCSNPVLRVSSQAPADSSLTSEDKQKVLQAPCPNHHKWPKIQNQLPW